MPTKLKDTLTLPSTEFPMRANLVQREPERIKHWEKEGLYEKIQEKNADNPSFILHDGPPFTSGDVHIGTALNKCLKESIIRYKSMKGFRAPYIPGWDCHGLPIEQRVTREMREQGKDLPSSEIRNACSEFSMRFMDIQREQFVRLGILADWEQEYRTLDPEYEADILRTFSSFIDKGLVYRSKKPVYWSIPYRTALAEAEIEYKDHVSPSIWVKFKLPDTGALAIEGDVSIVIWTTTPWTIPANLALALHPRVHYVVMVAGDQKLIVAKDLAESVAKNVELGEYTIEKEFKGEALDGLISKHPFIDRDSPILLADYVTTETGTGAVHTAPGHGLEDYMSGLKYGLEIYCPLDNESKYIDDGQIPAELVGVSVLEKKGRSQANVEVLKLLEDSGNLLKFEKFEHSYPHCWRSKTPVIFRATPQWFVSMDTNGFREQALEAISKVDFVPSWGENRIRGAVEGRPDWCVSRQRSWGVPIPAFYDEEGEAYVDAEVVRAIAAKIEKEGTNYWFENDAATILDGIDLPESWQGKSLSCGKDTLDVWIDSGSSHQAVLKRRDALQFPADLYLEGSDQHRGWFQSSLWTSMAAEGKPPYKEIVTHGFIVRGDGTKISKSDNKGGKPQTSDAYIKQYGADVIRLWIASQDYRNDIPVSDDIIKRIVDSYRLVRNTLRFQLSNLFDFNAESDAVAIEDLDVIDRWALSKTAELIGPVTEAYDKYEFHRVYQLINQFFSVTLSAMYHDMLKDRLYTLAPDSALRRSSQTAIYQIFKTVSRLLAPIVAFTTDEAWSYFKNGEEYSSSSIHLEDWPEAPESWKWPENVEEFENILKFRTRVNELLEKARQGKEIGKSLDAVVSITGSNNDPLFQTLQKYEPKLPEIFITSQVSLEPTEIEAVSVTIQPANGERCPRCWRTVESLLETTIQDNLCPRCKEALNA
ncbi:isoleucine--tRNA ligase [Opitutia bacterium ISCC 51]|nr:isoleucine--tRNA ligase [Opitutae bacterium ISCC 51]QXD26943.1 isoleucine--tRNA ligase [Opitutae bacterium ISCC 52]